MTPTSSPRVRGRLRSALRERQMTVEELRELTQLDAAAVARALASRPSLFLDEALVIAGALECPVGALYRLT